MKMLQVLGKWLHAVTVSYCNQLRPTDHESTIEIVSYRFIKGVMSTVRSKINGSDLLLCHIFTAGNQQIGDACLIWGHRRLDGPVLH
jgi:hypothetical protein